MKNILLIEDDVFLNQLYTDILTQEGYNVESVADGTIALHKMQKNSWDLILLDVLLPGIDGFDILKTIKNEHKKLSCPVIFMTNLDGTEDDKERLSAADDYWIKSNMSPPEFVEKVKNILA